MKAISFATALVAIAKATHIIYREDIPASEYIVNKEEFPFYFAWPAEGYPVCGGTMVTAQHMITAAHCIEEGFDNGFSPFEIELKGKPYKVTDYRPLSCYCTEA